ncbi:MAG: hypothetical protein JNM75_08285 [Rhodospirillales bacterium]|nr:hypothetical protein [Rhodospirillales bacterium]
MDRAVRATALNLSGLTVLTEAATGAYATTAVVAAMAGAARVYAFAKPSRHGSVVEAEAEVLRLAACADVAPRVTVVQAIEVDLLRRVDIVTNSGHLRPLNAWLLNGLPGRAVVALMFEAWETRPGDIDLDVCRRRNIPVVGVNERHPTVDVFSFLGPLCVRQLHDCGIAVYGSRLALLCDNDFAAWIRRGLQAMGASVELFARSADVLPEAWDAIVVAMRPLAAPDAKFEIEAADVRHLAAVSPPGIAVVQFWGDVDRGALKAHGLSPWPPDPPSRGHMGILLSAIGPEPVVRLQAGGLRAAELVFRGELPGQDGIAQLLTGAPPRSPATTPPGSYGNGSEA